jgi:antirestriction protein ArdC
MSKVKLNQTVRENPMYPKNGITQKSYKNTNYHTLNESYENNEYIYNVWVTEKQCESVGVSVTDRSNQTHTVDRFGNQTEIFNISQTDFMKPRKKKSVSSKPTQLQRIETLEKLVHHLLENQFLQGEG